MRATEDRADLRRRQHAGQWQIASDSADLAAPALGPIERRQQQRGLPGSDGLADLLKPGNCETGPARQTDRIAAAARQQPLDAIGQPRRHGNRSSRRTREQPLRHRVFDYIAARRQPQTPAGKLSGGIRDEFSARPDDKAQQRRAVANFTGGDTATLWLGCRRFPVATAGRGALVNTRRVYSCSAVCGGFSASSYQ